MSVVEASKHPDVEPPDPTYARARWIPNATVDWVKHCDEIMLKHGHVVGSQRYAKQHQARHRARRLKRLMVELRMHEPWQLKEHIERVGDKWVWSVEYLGRN